MKKVFKKHNILRIVAVLTLLGTLLPIFAACDISDYTHTHSPVEDPEVPATCSQTGLTKGSHCSVCGKTIVEQKEIPILAHTYDDEYDKDCNVCGTTRVVACRHSDLEHHAKKNATCEIDGNIEYYYCADCKTYFADKNATSELDYLDTIKHAQGHTPVEIPGVAPTYTSKGWTSGSKCSTCGEILREREPIDPLDPEEGSIEYYNIEGVSEPIPVDYYSYVKHEGLVLPTPKREHYDFLGWYIFENGEKKRIEAIEPDMSTGTAKKYQVFAEWTLTTYTITRYVSASNKLEDFTYTIEDIKSDKGLYIPGAPEDSGLHFDCWTEEHPDVVSEKLKTNTAAGLTALRINSPKDAGNKTVTAMWKTSANMLVSANDTSLTQEWYDDEYGQYYFAYHIGTYDNVIINQIYSKYHDGMTEINEKVTVTEFDSETKSETVSQTITKSTATINTHNTQKEWAGHYNHTHTTSENVGGEGGLGFNIFGIEIKLGASVGVNTTDQTETGFEIKGTVTEGSTVETENSETQTVTTNTTIVANTETVTTSEFMVAKDSPIGYYCCAETATVHVFAIISYDVATGEYYMNMHSIIYAPGTITKMYSPTSVGLNPKFEGMNYSNIPVDEIANSTYVTYTDDDGKTNVVRYEEKTSIQLADSYSTDNGTLCGITIPNTVKEFTITGEAGKTYDKIDIVVGSVKAGEELKLNLKNFNATGSISASKDSKVSLTIKCSGDNQLLATSTDGAIYGFDNVTVSGSGNLSVYGKDGANGANGVTSGDCERGAAGENGSNGCTAISVDALIVNENVSLIVVGGNGGAGGNGGNGNSGFGVGDSWGGYAGAGGNGGDAISASSITALDSAKVTATGGAGGAGGTGGKGQAFALDKANGGNGGDGGDGGCSYNVSCTITDESGLSTFSPGAAGSAGSGGAGDGGSYGSNGSSGNAGAR